MNQPSCNSSIDDVYETLLESQEPETEPDQQVPLANKKITTLFSGGKHMEKNLRNTCHRQRESVQYCRQVSHT